MITIGPVLLGQKPHIIGSLETPLAIDDLRNIPPAVQLVECRLDLWKTTWEQTLTYLKTLYQENRFGILGTLRETPHNVATRSALFTSILPYIHSLDIEIDTPIRDSVIQLAKAQRKTVMVSYHDYKQTPSHEALSALVAESLAAKADIVKLAVTANSAEDAAQLMVFTEQHRHLPLIAIAMGPWGRLTRVAAPLFGSLLSYGYVTQSVAPGQLSIQALSEAFSLYYPPFSAQ